jgi:hypothetical protein
MKLLHFTKTNLIQVLRSLPLLLNILHYSVAMDTRSNRHVTPLLHVIPSGINDDFTLAFLLTVAPMREPKCVTSWNTPPPCAVMCLRVATVV